MSRTENINKGRRKNTLLMYRNIKVLYSKYKTPDIPDTVVLRKYIFPIYPISQNTLNTALCTAVEKELKEMGVDAPNNLLDLLRM